MKDTKLKKANEKDNDIEAFAAGSTALTLTLCRLLIEKNLISKEEILYYIENSIVDGVQGAAKNKSMSALHHAKNFLKNI